jgi:hypothetical protein
MLGHSKNSSLGPAGTFAFFLCCISTISVCTAQEFAPMGRYATPGGQIVDLQRSGFDISGKIFDPKESSVFEITGVNKSENRMTLSVTKDGQSAEYEYELVRERFKIDGANITVSSWKTGEGADMSGDLGYLTSIIAADDPTLSDQSYRSVPVETLLEAKRAAERFFQSTSINYRFDSDQAFTEFSGGGNFVDVAVGRTDLSILLADEWRSSDSLEAALRASDARIRTLSAQDSVAALGPNSWKTLWDAAIDPPSARALDPEEMTPAISVRDIPTRNRQYRTMYAPEDTDISKQIKAKNGGAVQRIAGIKAQMDNKCDYSVDRTDIAIICDYHSVRYGVADLAWMRTRVSFLVESHAEHPRMVRILLIPTSVVARRFTAEQYELAKAANYKVDVFTGFWEQQSAFLDEVETYLKANFGMRANP